MNSKIIAIDIETTGLDKDTDEILQVSICDLEGHTILNMYIRPTRHKEWPEAMKINKITPESLVGMPTWEDSKEHIQRIINLAEEVVTYNGNFFDIPFLEKKGIKFDHIKAKHDAMIMFAIYRGELDEEHGRYKRFKLTQAAEHFNYDFKAHDSEQDALATAHIFNCMSNIIKNKTRHCHWRLTSDDMWHTGCGFLECNNASSNRSLEDKIIFGSWTFCPICGKQISTR